MSGARDDTLWKMAGGLLRGWALIKDNVGPAALLLAVAGLLIGIAYWGGRLDTRVRGFESGTDRRFKTQNELIKAKFQAQDEKIEARLQTQDHKIETRLRIQDESIAAKFGLLNNRIDDLTEALNVLKDDLNALRDELNAFKDVVATALAANPSGTKPPTALASESTEKPSP